MMHMHDTRGQRQSTVKNKEKVIFYIVFDNSIKFYFDSPVYYCYNDLVRVKEFKIITYCFVI